MNHLFKSYQEFIKYFLVGILTIFARSAPAEVLYHISEINVANFGPWRLNNASQVCGGINLQGVIVDLATNDVRYMGTLGGTSHCNSINDQNVAVGSSSPIIGANAWIAVLFDQNGLQQIPSLGGYPDGSARWVNMANDINESGDIIGTSKLSDNKRFHGFVYSQSGKLIDFNVKHGLISDFTVLNGINGRGDVVGYTFESGAFIFSGKGFSFFQDVVQFNRINNSAVAVGYTYDSKCAYARGRKLKRVKPLQHDVGCVFNDVNSSGFAVGDSVSQASAYTAILYDGSSITNLNDVSDAKSLGWVLYDARAINDSGQIVGMGFLNGAQRPFLLNPLSGVQGRTRPLAP